MNRSTLVTGALGFVGGALTKRLISREREVTVLVRANQIEQVRDRFGDMVKTVLLTEISNLQPVDTIFHCATYYVFDHLSQDRPKLLESNVDLPLQIADAASRWDRPVSFVNISTFMQHFNSEAFHPTCLYASTKQAAEDLLWYYNLNSQLNVKTLVFPHIYGSGDARLKLINLLIKCAIEQSSIGLGSGKQVMDLVHIDDAVNALELADELESGRWSVSSSLELTVRGLVELIGSINKRNLDVSFDKSKDRDKDAFEIWKTAPSLPGWSPQQSLTDWIQAALIRGWK